MLSKNRRYFFMQYNYTYTLNFQENSEKKQIEIFACSTNNEKAGQLNGFLRYDEDNRKYYFILDNIYITNEHQKNGCGFEMMKLLKNILQDVESKYDIKIWWITGFLGRKGNTYPDWNSSLPFLEKCSKVLFGNYGFVLYDAAGYNHTNNISDFITRFISGHFVIKLDDYCDKQYQFYEINF